jgi:hypothetical protein
MTRQPFTPSTQDIRLLSEHLYYEMEMTFRLALGLAMTRGTVRNQTERNALLEAFTIHVRQMIDFLWGDRSEKPSSTDAFAADYFAPGEWAKLRPGRPAILDTTLWRKVGWGVAHLTYRRGRVTLQEKRWDTIALARALAPAVICFAENVDPAKLEPQHLSLLKPYAESVLPPNTPSTSTATSAST